MIDSKEKLRKCLKIEKTLYRGNMNKCLFDFLSHFPFVIHESPELYKYIRLLRKTEYYLNTGKRFRAVICKTGLRYLQYKHGLSIPLNVFDVGLKIQHLAQTRVSSQSKIGKNFTIYPFCSVGTGHGKSPIIGDNVTVFSGARVIGPVELANGIQVGANAVVTKSCDVENAVLVGVPAKMIPLK